jgi:hypothetical protein
MKYLSTVKRVSVAAVVAAAMFTGTVISAQALQFNTTGDAVLVLYGNDTQYVQNLGSFANLATSAADINLSSILGLNTPNGPNGLNQIQYTIVGRSATQFIFGTANPITDFTAGNKSSLGTNSPNYLSALNGWSQNLAAPPSPDTRSLIPATDPLSFSSFLDPSGGGTLGMLPAGKQGFSTIDSVLYLLERNVGSGTANNNSLAQVYLANIVNGHLMVSVSAVPVPAAAILFATGVIGLVGIARRRIMGLR